MSVGTTMYTLKPIISLPSALYRSQSMYDMRTIHEDSRGDDHTGTEGKNGTDIIEQVTRILKKVPEYSALEARQEKILTQLAELKKHVSTLRKVLNQTSQPGPILSSNIQTPISLDLVINVNPKRPPYSVVALNHIWADTEVNVKTYVHSTVKTKLPSLCGQALGNKVHNPSNHAINLFLIWKEVEDLELVLGVSGYPIKGEINLLRYLSRLFMAHNYENVQCVKQVNLINTVLDLCHCLYNEKVPKKQEELVVVIVNKLDNNKSSKKGKLTIADLAVWSTIKHVFPKNIPLVISKWFQAHEKRII